LRHVDELELVIDDAPRRGVGPGVVVSIILHAIIVIYLVKSYRAPSKDAPAPPIAPCTGTPDPPAPTRRAVRGSRRQDLFFRHRVE